MLDFCDRRSSISPLVRTRRVPTIRPPSAASVASHSPPLLRPSLLSRRLAASVMSFQPNNAFEEQFRQFLQEPETQDAIRGDQEKEIKVMKKMDEFESLHELTGQREQLAVALQDLDAESQRLIYPILRLKMVQHILFAALKETRSKQASCPSLIARLRNCHSRQPNAMQSTTHSDGRCLRNAACQKMAPPLCRRCVESRCCRCSSACVTSSTTTLRTPSG